VQCQMLQAHDEISKGIPKIPTVVAD